MAWKELQGRFGADLVCGGFYKGGINLSKPVDTLVTLTCNECILLYGNYTSKK